MHIWSMWLDAIQWMLGMLSSEAGMGLGLAIVLGTLILRSLLLPISWSIAYRNLIRSMKLRRLKPRLEELRRRFRDRPEVYLQKMTALYRSHDLAVIDNRSLLGAAVQMPLLMGMYQVLRRVGEGVRFLWVPNLLKPDIVLALLVAVSTALMMALTPDMAQQLRLVMIIIPAIIAFIIAVKFSSALALYLATSNVYSAVQSCALQCVIRRQVRSGEIRI